MKRNIIKNSVISLSVAALLLTPTLAQASDSNGSTAPLGEVNHAGVKDPVKPAKGSISPGMIEANKKAKEIMDAAKASAKSTLDAAKASGKEALEAAKKSAQASKLENKTASEAARKAAAEAFKVLQDKFKVEVAAYQVALKERMAQVEAIRVANKPAYDKIKLDYQTAEKAASTPEMKKAAKDARDAAFKSLSLTVKTAIDALPPLTKPVKPTPPIKK